MTIMNNESNNKLLVVNKPSNNVKIMKSLSMKILMKTTNGNNWKKLMANVKRNNVKSQY